MPEKKNNILKFKDDKKKIESILQDTWESADDWFY